MRLCLIEERRVSCISSRWINELLRRANIRPHKNKYWLTSKDRTDPNFDQRVAAVCDAYAVAVNDFEQHGVHTICIDEQTGIQALERISPDRLVLPGQVARREYEYHRHGTLCLFGNLHVATGKILEPMIRQTRTEDDFLENIDQLVVKDPAATYRFITDNLNTHASESMVRYVAEACDIEESLGVKGRHGILESVQSRVAFLSDPTHRIRFIYTPRHCSWLNQIEIWFGTLRKKVTHWMSFAILEELEEGILSFIGYYNKTHAKPYRWTYTGRVLAA